MFKQTFVCPYCFEERKLSELQFRCTNKRCADVDDVELTKYENGDITNPMKGKICFPVQLKGGSVPREGICPTCGEKSHKIVCPACHNPLPEATITGKDMIFSIIGARGSGKTNFVSVLIQNLSERIVGSFNDGSIEGFDDTMSRFRKGEAYNYLYIKNEVPPKTVSSLVSTENGAFKPLIYTIKFQTKGFLKKEIESFTFAFFDTAGEDLEDADTMNTVNKYIYMSSGILFLLDPMQIPAVVNQLDDDTVSRSSAASGDSDSSAIMTRVSNMIRDYRHLKSDKTIDIPVAAVFSKLDAFSSLIPEGSTVLDPSPHCDEGKFDLTDAHNVDSEIRSLLTTWGESNFIKQVDINYSNTAFFACSALGMNNNPKANGKIERPRPHRIEDPILWLLMQNNVIKAGK
jgi:GTPase SAR1 family protein